MNLEPLRRALLAHAHADAALVLAGADARGAAIRAAADDEAERVVRQARADGAAAAAIAGAHDEAQARRAARALVLAAERELYDELCREALRRAGALRQSGDYNALVARLAGVARAQLGQDASVEVDEPAGGVRASRNGCSVDYTLPTLVARALDGLGARTEELWAPA